VIFGDATFQIVVNFLLHTLHAVRDCYEVAGDWVEEYTLQREAGK
jgi:hypothetical protein